MGFPAAVRGENIWLKSRMKKPGKSDMRILIINYEFPPLGGGGGIASFDLAQEWAKKAEVDVITSSFKDLPAVEIVDNINIYRVKILFRKSRDAASFLSMLTYLPGAFIKGIILFRRKRYDVINTHFAVPSGPVGYLLGRIFKTPNVLSLHGGDIYDPSKKLSPHKNPFFSRAVKFFLNHTDKIIAQSSNTKYNAIQYYHPKKDISIIPLAFHPPQIPDISRDDLNINKGDFILTVIGRIVKRKAIDVIIRALVRIPDERIKLFVMGDGPEKQALQKLAQDMGVEKRVFFLGYVEEKEKYSYLSNSDLFVLTAMHEGFGIVYMEAMYCGLPIVCTNNGGQVDFLKNEQNAILIDVGDTEGCANAILRFYKDKKLYRKCSVNNRERVKEFYAEQVANKYIKVFKDLI